MKKIYFVGLSLSALFLTGCAANDAIGDIAGKINGVLGSIVSTDSDSSNGTTVMKSGNNYSFDISNEHKAKGNIDDVYLRIKRRVGFITDEEVKAKYPNSENTGFDQAYKNANHFIYQAQPGVSYLMGDTFENGSNKTYVKVSIEKNGSGALVSYTIKSTNKKLLNYYASKIKV